MKKKLGKIILTFVLLGVFIIPPYQISAEYIDTSSLISEVSRGKESVSIKIINYCAFHITIAENSIEVDGKTSIHPEIIVNPKQDNGYFLLEDYLDLADIGSVSISYHDGYNKGLLEFEYVRPVESTELEVLNLTRQVARGGWMSLYSASDYEDAKFELKDVKYVITSNTSDSYIRSESLLVVGEYEKSDYIEVDVFSKIDSNLVAKMTIQIMEPKNYNQNISTNKIVDYGIGLEIEYSNMDFKSIIDLWIDDQQIGPTLSDNNLIKYLSNFGQDNNETTIGEIRDNGEGGTILVLYKEYIDTLENGSHAVLITAFWHGRHDTLESEFKVQRDIVRKTVVETSDISLIGINVLLVSVSVTLFTIVSKRSQKV
ncbi:MAG: hypothetical protein ACK5LC_12580 [Coprobacillaceae bacterium]